MIEVMLDSLPADRREAVAAWLNRSIGDCVHCGQPVLISQPRAVQDPGFRHLGCDASQPVRRDDERMSKNVAANAARSDWG
jgi:hypothetical protein